MGDTETTKSNLKHDDSDVEEGSSVGMVSILNDFCLLQILNRLDVSDLCNVVNLNNQFKRVSMMSFSARYAKFCYPEHINMYFHHSNSIDLIRSHMRRVLCNFGHLIKSLKLKDCHPAGIFSNPRPSLIEMDVISKYCAGTLDELKLNLFLYFDCDLAKPLFLSLKTLIIYSSGTWRGDASGLFSECRELKTLESHDFRCTEPASEIAQKYPNLEVLSIGTAFYNVETTFALLQKNLQIKKLDIFNDNANKTICAIASKMENLEELVLRWRCELSDYDNVNELGKLRSLKVLELHDAPYQFVPAIEAMQTVSLERLKWFDCPSNLEFLNSIMKLKTIKSLALTAISSPIDDFLINMGEQLSRLEALELGFKHQEESLFSINCLVRFVERSSQLNVLVIHTVHSEVFSQQFYDSLLEVIRKRSSETKLQVTIYDNGKTLVSLQVHSDLLKVEFFVGVYCTCSHCEPLDNLHYDMEYDEYDDYDFDGDSDDNYVDLDKIISARYLSVRCRQI